MFDNEDADLPAWNASGKVEGFLGRLGHYTNRRVLDLEKLRAVEKDRWLVVDRIAQHRQGGQPALALRRIPDLFDNGLAIGYKLATVAGSPDIGQRSGEGGGNLNAATHLWRGADLPERSLWQAARRYKCRVTGKRILSPQLSSRH